MMKKLCRRCLLDDMPGQAALAKSVRELVDLLPEEIRASEKTARDRLAVCVQCEHLANGMCALCGCYVELRTAKGRLSCPDVPARWSREERKEHAE